MQTLIDLRTARVLFTALLFALVLGFLYVAHNTLIAFLFAIFFAYLMEPAISRIEKWTHSRGLAIAAVYLVLALVLAVFFFFVGPKIARQAQHFRKSLPGLLQKVGSGQIAQEIGQEHGWSEETRYRLQSFLISHRDTLSQLAQRAGIRIAEVAQSAWLLVVVPILAAFFLRDGRQFGQTLLSFANTQPQREFVQGVLGDLNQMLAHFIRAQLTLAAFSLVIYISVMSAIKVPYALVLGTAGGFLEFIPVVGPLVAALLIMGAALLLGYAHWLVLLIFLAVWRLTQDYVITPRIMGQSMELHPLGAIFGVLAGGEIAGVLGVYLSIPVMASLRIVWRRWRLYAEKTPVRATKRVLVRTEIVGK